MGLDTRFDKLNGRLEHLLRRRLGLSRGNLATRAVRARGRLPKAVKRDLITVAEAARLSGNPRIAPQIDAVHVQAAYKRAVDHLYGPEVAAKRSGRRIGILTGLVVNLTIAAMLGAGFIVWRGLI